MNFTELFISARAISTPIIGLRTFDPTSTINNVKKALDTKSAANKKTNLPDYADSANTPLITWDCMHGLRGLGEENNLGSQALMNMAKLAGVELAASIDLALALGILEFAAEDCIVFVHNPQLYWDTDPKVVQGIWNLRDGFKAGGNMLALLFGIGDELPAILQQDVLVLDDPLTTREELEKIILNTYVDAAKEHKACKKMPEPTLLKSAIDALVGLPAFPAESSAALCLDKATGILDIEELWMRKRDIMSERRGLTFVQPKETLADMYGNEGFASFARRYMEGPCSPNVILRVDEIQRQFSGNETDTSGSTGKQLGEFLTWVEDHKVVCTLLVGVPGSSKSWSSICIAGHYHKPLIKYDLSAMEDKLVGEGGKIQRENERVVESISDGKIWLIATANKLDGMPAELLSRFQIGGIFFFDIPDTNEKLGIMKLKMAMYKLPDQPMPEMIGWSGRDINNCAYKAQFLNCSLVDAAKFVLPLMQSNHEEIDRLRQGAHERFLSAAHEGVYVYTSPPAKTVVHAPVTTGRKIR